MAGPNTTWHAFLAHFLAVLVPWRRSHVALELQRDMAGAQYDVAHSFCPLLGCFGAFEVEPRRVGGPTRHGGAQCDMTRSFCSLLGCFGAFEVEPRRVGGPTRHGGAQYDVARSFRSLLGCFGPFGTEPRRVGGPTRHGRLPMRRGALFLLPFGQLWHLWGGATSCWRPNATWQAPNATWRTRFDPFWAALAPLRWSHVVLEVQRDMPKL